MVAGADSIDDMSVLRHGAMARVFDRPYAPSTLGSFLRKFAIRTFGVVAPVAVFMISGALIATAPPATAGCVPYGEQFVCNRPIRPDDTWKR